MNKNKIAVEIFNKYADSYQNKFMDVSLYSSTFDFFCDHLKENASVLELACGPGNITKYLLNKRPDLRILGTDLSPNMVGLAKINNPAAEFQVMDGRKFGTLNKEPARMHSKAGGFDAIMCGFFLPYLSKEECEKLIADVSQTLNSNGIIYISTMEDDYENSGLRKGSQGDEIFMHYYQGAYLAAVLEKNSFKILKTERIESIMTDETKVTDLILIAKK